MEANYLSDPQSRQQDAHQEDPRAPDLRLEGQPHRGGRAHHREGNLQVENPVDGQCTLFTNLLFRAAAPSGASTGIYEALEMRDKAESWHKAETWHGKGVQEVLGLKNPGLLLDVENNVCLHRRWTSLTT